MGLRYRQEMNMTKVWLDELADLLADRHVTTKTYRTISPEQSCLIGVVGPRPDPDYLGPQPPNALGMVIGVTPTANGDVAFQMTGGFDVTFCFVPEIDHMLERLTYENDGTTPRRTQLIAPSFQRRRVTIDDTQITLNIADAGTWHDASNAIDACLSSVKTALRTDERAFGLMRMNDRGRADRLLQWRPCATQEELNILARAQLFDKLDCVLPYSVTAKARLRPAPVAFGKEGLWLLEVYLVNLTSNMEARSFGVDQACLLDARFRVSLTEGMRFNVPHRLQPEDYRYRPSDNVPGYGIGCLVREIDPRTVETETFPIIPQQRFESPSPLMVGMSTNPTYAILASDPIPALEDFLRALGRYRDDWKATITGLVEPAEVKVAEQEARFFDDETSRVKAGIATLKKDLSLLRAFKLMNETIGNAIKLQGKSFNSWHLFQIAFILTQINSVAQRFDTEDHLQTESGVADVLWFATGGGKTEAYLGIILIALFHARIKGRYAGSTAWMRFPLRMLSVQQFSRLSYVIAQAEMIRVRENIPGHPFTLGYFTGSQGTPNRISQPDPEGSGQRTFLPLLSDEQLDRFRLISDCPYCGTRGSVRVKKHLPTVRIRHECENPECWSNTVAGQGSYGEGIRGEVGIYVSDEECYRYLPSVLVGTVDKLAVIGHNARFRLFFGGAKGFCPIHGFTRESRCEHSNVVHNGVGWEKEQCKLSSRSMPEKVIPVPALKDPGFSMLIQDELHLMQESMGNFDSHYESLLNALQRAAGGQVPKILAATATIKEFENHVHHLYLREGRRFPAAGATNGETFYARRHYDDATGEPLIRRFFAGVMPIAGAAAGATSRSTAKIAIRSLALIDRWRDALRVADPVLLARLGMSSTDAPDALAWMERNLNTQLMYVSSKRSIDEILRFLDDDESGRERGTICKRIDAETPLDEILQTIRHIENKKADDPKRQFIATSVVSHGVDIAELNLMIINGWPNSTAEYIQSSARSGRVHPGIVISVLSWMKLFEHNVFLNFNDYHFFIDRLVESVPINRFAPNLLARTMPAVVAAVIYNWAMGQKSWGQEIGYKAQHVSEALKSGGAAAQDGMIRLIVDAMAIQSSMVSHFDQRLTEKYNATVLAEAKRAVWRLLNWQGGKPNATITDAMEEIFGHKPMYSLRDIESQIVLKTQNTLDDEIIEAIA